MPENNPALPSLIVIVGPTASGKTSLGIELASRQQGAVVSADSRQIYAGMNIGTAKPGDAWSNDAHAIETPDTVSNVNHYLFNIAYPDQQLSLAEWQQHAFSVIDSVNASGKTSLLVGGTMLYIDSIVYNYSLPVVPPNESFRNELEQRPVEELFSRLIEQDPAAKDFIESRNKRRIIRALEVMASTDQSFSKQRQKHSPRYNVRWIGLFPGWDALRENVTIRIRAMIREGLLEETRNLQKRYSPDLPLLSTMNYKQTAAILNNQLTEEQAIDDMIKVNMRYAHRQMSWWKRNNNIQWFGSAEEALKSL